MNPITIIRALPFIAIGVLALGLLWYRGEALDAEAERNLMRIERDGFKTSLETADKNRTETERRYNAQQEAYNAKEDEIKAARRDADNASAAGRKLRAQLATLAAGCKRGNNSGVGESGATDGTAADLLANVQQRLDEATDGIARYADEASAAGRACERSYDALTASH